MYIRNTFINLEKDLCKAALSVIKSAIPVNLDVFLTPAFFNPSLFLPEDLRFRSLPSQQYCIIFPYQIMFQIKKARKVKKKKKKSACLTVLRVLNISLMTPRPTS